MLELETAAQRMRQNLGIVVLKVEVFICLGKDGNLFMSNNVNVKVQVFSKEKFFKETL